MQRRVSLEVIDRRDLLLGAAAAGLLLSAGPAGAQDKQPTFDEVLKGIVKDAKPAESKVAIDIPEIAENGNMVPFSITVESPMTDADHVKAVHLLASGNPQALVASFDFTPAAGKATVSSRMRLAKTQDIVAVACMSGGQFHLAKRTIKVTIGGCGG